MKKILSVLLISVFALTGCGSSADKEVVQKEGDTITVLTGWSDKSDYNNNAYKAYVEEVTGEQVEYVMPPLDSADSKIMLELSSKTPYNVAKVSASAYSTILSKNMALDLKPYLEEYGQNILNAMSPQAWASVTDPETGAIYGIPASGGSKTPNGAITYRKDILAKEGLSEPKTTAEFTTTICTLADRGYKTPYAINWKSSYWEYSLKADYGIGWYWNLDENGELVFVALDPRYEEYINFLKGIYDCGGFGTDYETITQEQKTQRFISGDAVFMEDVWWNQTSMSEAMALNGVNYYDAVGVLPPMEGLDGQMHINANGADYFEVAIIPVYMEEYAVQTIKFIDKQLEREVWENLTYGSPEQENVTWAYCPDGTTKYQMSGIDESTKKYYGAGVEGIGTIESLSFAAQECKDDILVEQVQNGVPNVDYKANDWYLAQLIPFYDYGITNPTGGALAIPSWNKVQAEVKTNLKDFTDLYVTGKSTKTLEQYQAELYNKYNMEQITKDMNAWYKASTSK